MKNYLHLWSGILVACGLLFSQTTFALVPSVVISKPNDISVIQDVPVNISVNVTANIGISSCALYADRTFAKTMNYSNGVASVSYSFGPSDHTLLGQTITTWFYVVCIDIDGDSYSSNSALATVEPRDTTPPVVTIQSSITAQQNVPVLISASAIDNKGVATCNLYVSGDKKSDFTFSENSTYASYTFPTAGNFAVFVRCLDASGNMGDSELIIVPVSAIADTSAPIIVTPPNLSVIKNASVNISTAVSDNVGVTSCGLYVEGVKVSNMNIANNSASTTYAFSTTGFYNYQVRCNDATGNLGISTNATANVWTSSSSNVVDTSAPFIYSPPSFSVVLNSPKYISTTITDNFGISSCGLYLNGNYASVMTVSGSTAYVNYAFPYLGSVPYQVRCSDVAGNIGMSDFAYATVTSTSTSYNSVSTKTLIKTVCTSYVGVNDPCKSVYYFGSDGKRHAFTNSKVFFTWYSDFSSVNEINATTMASIPLGKNVTYRPGVRMIKFETVNKVYAVAAHGELRWVTSESAATQLYGTNWNKFIDDVSDVFVGNYKFGAPIYSIYDYNPLVQTNGTVSIDDSL